MSEVIDSKQRLLIEYMIADNVVFSKCVRVIQPDYFDAPLDKVVDCCLEYFHKHHGCPTVDIVEAETGIELKARSVDADEVSYVLEEVETHCKNAAMTAAILQSVDMIHEDKLSEIQELVRRALLVKIDNSVGTSIFTDPVTRINMMDQAVDSRSTNIEALDQLVGDVHRGELGLIYAVSSGGKSVMLANIAKSMAAQELDVVILSLELNEQLYSKRMDVIISGEDIQNHVSVADVIGESLSEFRESSGNITVKKMQTGTTCGQIRAYLMEYHLAHGKYPDALIVDYMGLMGADGVSIGSMNKFDFDDIKTMGLRDIADEYAMYGFSAGQINRDGYGVLDIGPQHCAGGISAINNSDWAVFMAATEEDIDNNQIQMGQLKIRNHSRTSSALAMYRDPRNLQFSSVPTNGTPKTPKTQSSPVVGKGKKSKKEEEATKTALTSGDGKDKLRAALKIKGNKV